MKAILIRQPGDNSVLNPENVEEKDLLTNQVKIKVEATTVNYIDILIRAGQMPPGMMPALPLIPGVECIGTVAEIGGGVTELTVGDRVAYFGQIAASTYAEYVVADSGKLVKIPESVQSAKAAVIPVNYCTAYHMLHNLAKISQNSTIFVHAAAGGVGTAIIQLAKIAGATVIGSVGSDDKKQYIISQGADYAINYQLENLQERINEITDGKGVDVSLNPVSGQSMIDDLEFLSPFGHLIIFGFITGLPEEKLQEAMLKHFGKSLTISFSDIYTLYGNDFSRLKEIMSTLYGFLNEGKINPVVYKELPLSEASEAHDLLESGKVEGKLVLVP